MTEISLNGMNGGEDGGEDGFGIRDWFAREWGEVYFRGAFTIGKN